MEGYWVFEGSWGILASHSGSDVFVRAVREPRKQRGLDFNSARQTLELAQFTTTDYARLHFSGNRSDTRD